ncbi:MAG: RNA methyltransferase [Anaerolineae bacterium]|nr:RNA methyltransferase [Anaerolineae bacterium]MDQ7036565.1 RNA methyltransferase [Anaerolineae bacterium]
MSDSLYDEFLAQIDDYQIVENRMRRMVSAAMQRQRGLMVIMEEVYNPHNLAAIARSCDAFGVQNLAFLPQNPDDFDIAATNSTSVSAFKWLDYRMFSDGIEAALTTLKAEGWHIMATWVNPEASSIYETDFTQYDKLALLVGNEHTGLSAKAIELADSYVYIPMLGFVQSFNVSVAAAISLFEITRQRRASDKEYQFDTDTIRTLTKDFLKRQASDKT